MASPLNPWPLPPANPNSPYYNIVRCDKFISELIVPDFAFVWNPVTLTIKIRYSLNFVDSRTKSHNPEEAWTFLEGYAGTYYEGHYARDSNEEYFKMDDWDFNSQRTFARKFKDGQAFWDRKFMLTTPDEYSGFDYQLLDDVKNNTSWRPNVLCRFELISVPNKNDIKMWNSWSHDSDNPGVHLRLDVVKTRGKKYNGTTGSFRSHSLLYNYDDVDEYTIWHELGHALGQDHIQALLGNGACIMGDGNAGPCYVTPEGMEPNVMGSGKGLLDLNAIPWVELIQHHTKTIGAKWEVTQNTVMPPRKIPGVVPKKPVVPLPAAVAPQSNLPDVFDPTRT